MLLLLYRSLDPAPRAIFCIQHSLPCYNYYIARKPNLLCSGACRYFCFVQGLTEILAVMEETTIFHGATSLMLVE